MTAGPPPPPHADPAPRAQPPSRRWDGIVLAAVLALTAAAYARVIDGELEFDDFKIRADAAVRDMAAFFGEGAGDKWLWGARPLTDLTFALNHLAGGFDPGGYHVVNIVLHLLTGAALAVLGRQLGRAAGVRHPEWISLAAASLFAAHPIQTGAVSYISQRAEVLASALAVASLVLVLRAERGGTRARAGVLSAGATLLFLLALAAKPNVVSMAAALVWGVMSLSPVEPGPRPLARRLALAAPVVALAVAFSARMFVMITSPEARDAGFRLPGLTPRDYALTQLHAVPTYVRLLAWPRGQNVDWDFPISRGLGTPPATLAGAILLVLAAAGAGWLWWRSRAWPREEDRGAARLALFGLGWFVLALVPTSSVVPLLDVFFEHRVYLACWGLFLAAAVAVERVASRFPSPAARRAALGAAGALVLALLGATWARNAVWEDGVALWSDSVSKSPRKVRPWFSLGSALARAGRAEEAVRAYEQALRLAPSPTEERDTVRNLSSALEELGRSGEAVALLRRYTARFPVDAQLAVNLAVALVNVGALGEAEAEARRSAMLDPSRGEAHGVVGSVLLRKGDPAAALLAFERAISLLPESAGLRLNRGVALDRLGRTREACEEWGRAVSLEGRPVVVEKIRRLIAARRCAAAAR